MRTVERNRLGTVTPAVRLRIQAHIVWLDTELADLDRGLRAPLYMAALVANPTIRAFYQRLCATGKRKKVALATCMHKLLLIAMVHVAVALDVAGRAVGQWARPNNAEGWADVETWARSVSMGAERRWGIEGAWNGGCGLAPHLVATGKVVREINARWTARGRCQARNVGKTDARDA